MEREHKKLYRVNKDKMLGGVSMGLAEYFDVDVTIIRLLFLGLAVFAGGGILLYIILWIMVPMEDNNEITYYSNLNTNQTDMNEQAMPNQEKHSSNNPNRGKAIFGVILIFIGGLILLDKFVPHFNFGDLWPIILIVLGLFMVFSNLTNRK